MLPLTICQCVHRGQEAVSLAVNLPPQQKGKVGVHSILAPCIVSRYLPPSSLALETPPVSAGTTVTRGTTTIPVAPPPNLANPEKVVSVCVYVEVVNKRAKKL